MDPEGSLPCSQNYTTHHLSWARSTHFRSCGPIFLNIHFLMIKKEAVKGRPGSGDTADDNYSAQAQTFDGIATSSPYSPQSTPVKREKQPSERYVLNGMNVQPLRAVKYRSRPSQYLQSGHTQTDRQTTNTGLWKHPICSDPSPNYRLWWANLTDG